MWVCGSRVCVICAPGPERPEIAVISGVSAPFPTLNSAACRSNHREKPFSQMKIITSPLP